MKNTLVFFLLLLLSACASSPQRSGTTALTPDEKMNELVMYSLGLADTPYHFGGNSPDNGFDCSGFVDHVFRHSLGISLPRTSHEISQLGMTVNKAHLRPGDLVFYNTQHSAYSHVGIYVGEDKFIHAPKTGSQIRVEKMNEKYWLNRYNGARRIRE
jgi:cell wall-associated NlpC family hydrolase